MIGFIYSFTGSGWMDYLIFRTEEKSKFDSKELYGWISVYPK